VQGEAALDAGGVAREWFEGVVRELFDTARGLFKFSHVDNLSYQIDPASCRIPDFERWFRFVGRVIGKAMLDHIPCGAHFTPSVYKAIIGVEVWRERCAASASYPRCLSASTARFHGSHLAGSFDCDASVCLVLGERGRHGDSRPHYVVVHRVDAAERYHGRVVRVVHAHCRGWRFRRATSRRRCHNRAFSRLRRVSLARSSWLWLCVQVDETNKQQYVMLLSRWRLVAGVRKQMDALLKVGGARRVSRAAFMTRYDLLLWFRASSR
jgi:hypothetical protein